MAAALGAIPSLLGGLAGLFNPRPPALNNAQSGALNSLIPSLMNKAQGTPTIDPTQQALMYGNVAQNQTGAMNAATHALTGAGLGHSGLLGNALTQVANQAQQSRNQGNMGLQQQAIQQQQFDLQTLLGLLNVNATGGQSGAGAFTAGVAPIAAYSIQNMLNQNGANSNQNAMNFASSGNLPLSANPGTSVMGGYQ
jgi:hypothetical protein